MADSAITQVAVAEATGRLIPRLYQQEIFQRAVNENVICAMDTGSGKTQIAVMLLKHIMSLRPADSNPKKASVAVFLVASVPLAEQQGDFLESQLPLHVNVRPVFLLLAGAYADGQKFYGAMGVDYWDRERWAKAFAESDVMVMTAQVFHDLLNHAHWSIDKVLLLVFDEAHHCNKNHVYAQIMRTHYHHCPVSERPRIFGMTASPIFNIRNPAQSLAQLQETMDAKVLAVKDNVLELALNAPKPQEFVMECPPPSSDYSDYPRPTMWSVVSEFENLLFPDPDDLKDLTSRYKHALNELGPLAADYFVLLFIRRAIEKSTVGSSELGAYFSRASSLAPETGGDSSPVAGQTWSDLDNAYNEHLATIQERARGLDKSQMMSWLTPKLKILISILEANRADDFSALIFVEQRQVASALAWLLPLVPELRDWVKAAALVGHGDGSRAGFEGSGMAHAAQRSTVRNFRSGSINLVIATSVAEEGLDFQACKLVVRLDAPQTMVGYLQSRGRARKHDSAYVVLTDPEGAKRYRGFRGAEPHLRRIYQRISEEEAQQDGEMDVEEEEDVDNERYVVKSTGAVVTPSTAIGLLHLWCSQLEVDRFTKPPAPEFHITGKYMCKISAPPCILNPALSGPIHGPLKKTRDGARRAAAFLFVQKLHKLEIFDDYLLPFKKRSSKADDLSQRLDGTLRREGELFDTITPWGDVWHSGSPVWMNPISLDGSPTLVALVTGNSQPERELTIHKGDSFVKIKIHRGCLLEFASEEDKLARLEAMQRYSNCAIFWAITARKLPPRSTCLIAPLIGPEGLPDYDRMSNLATHAVKLSKEEWLNPELVGSLVMEAHRLGSTLYEFLGIKTGVDLSSCPISLEDGTKCRENAHETYRSYWEAATGTVKRGLALDIPEGDHWLELVSISKAQLQSHNGLYGLVKITGSEQPTAKPSQIVTPSHMARISPIPADIVRIVTHLPNLLGQMTVLFRIDSAKEILRTNGVPLELLLEALTLPSVQAGFDYQRLETIGDSVLKVSMCTHLFIKYQGHHEGQLSAMKDSVVSNANLMRVGRQSPLSRFLITGSMPTRRTWSPPASSTISETQDDSGEQDDSNEQKDDSNEQKENDSKGEFEKTSFHTKAQSTLGATYLSRGVEAALEVGEALGLPLGGTTPWHLRREVDVFARKSEITMLFAPVEEKLGYKFKNASLVAEAFTHTAYDLSQGPSYNRLEFLGDSLFDLYVVKFMYLKFPKMTPGQMSWARSRLVNASTFGKLAVGLELHKHILTSSANLQKAVASFAQEVEEISLEEILQICWKIDAPKAISDVFEAIFGAIYVDSSFNLELTFEHIHRVMANIMEYVTPVMQGDPTSELVRWVASQGCEAQGSTIFRSSSSSNSRASTNDTVETTVHGRTISRVTAATSKLARPMAAEQALNILKDETHDYALSKICSCPRAKLKRKASDPIILERCFRA
ncbi:Dicer dimerization domain [Rhizoctonia solani]|uniref:Dicer dimerization domain n=1 Tax=Rhizoctonia solani TaxID=456999 RepID=A0A8H7HC28_9AGAM|nr:Dicer dimerization domain [Rhizoctonia solani]